MRKPPGVAGRAPPPGDVVVVHRAVADREQPVVRVGAGQVRSNVLSQNRHQLVGKVDDAFGAILREPHVGGPVTLQLTGQGQGAPREVDVTELDGCRLALAEAREGAQGDVGAKPLACGDAGAVGMCE